MSNTKKFAERELDILVKSSTDPDNRPVIEEFIPEILALVDKFGHSGQSGGSAPFVASALSKAILNLCLQNPICPITGIDDEWMDVTEMGDGDIMFQNRRCGALFKDGRKKRPYYLDAIVWKDSKNKNNCWTGSIMLSDGEKVFSRQFINGFPFEPKTFYVEVVRETLPEDWNVEPFYEDKNYYNTIEFEETGIKNWKKGEKYRYVLKDEKQLHEVFSYYKSPWSRNVLIEKVI